MPPDPNSHTLDLSSGELPPRSHSLTSPSKGMELILGHPADGVIVFVIDIDDLFHRVPSRRWDRWDGCHDVMTTFYRFESLLIFFLDKND